MKQPWREVVRIESRTGPRGGRFWLLDLDCGHVAVRAQPAPITPGAVWRLYRSLSRYLAPKRARCAVCHPGVRP